VTPELHHLQVSLGGSGFILRAAESECFSSMGRSFSNTSNTFIHATKANEGLKSWLHMFRVWLGSMTAIMPTTTSPLTTPRSGFVQQLSASSINIAVSAVRFL
jgi:hypothetical protein